MRIPRAVSSTFYFFRFIFFTLWERSARYLRYYPGHYSSPIPSHREILQHRDRIFAKKRSLSADVEINTETQLEVLRDLYQYDAEFSFSLKPVPDVRYYSENGMFDASDAFGHGCAQTAGCAGDYDYLILQVH